MPKTINLTILEFQELSNDAKATARAWYRGGAFDYPWYENIYDDFEAICGLIGLDLRTSTVRLMCGGSRQALKIYFNGFWSQGDGACFEGYYRYRKGALTALRAYAPHDQELYQITSALFGLQRRNFYQLEASIDHRGRYCHAHSMTIDVNRKSPNGHDMSSSAEEGVKEALRDLARWLYRQLEREYEHLNSDDVIDDAIMANGYGFTENGIVHV